MKLKLVNKKLEARDTYSFFFEPVEKIDFQAGQYIYITLPKLNYPDERGDTRHFTISSSQTEGNLIRLTTRIREESGYKKTLNELKIGDEVEGRGPNQTFILDPKPKILNQVFLAGGIGVTPFRSFIKYNIDKSLRIPMHLIYSNSDSEFVFKQELDEWSKENDFIKIDYHDSSQSGHLSKQLISKYCEDKLQDSIFWVVGPPKFVSAMEEILEELNIPEDNIKSEKFTGY